MQYFVFVNTLQLWPKRTRYPFINLLVKVGESLVEHLVWDIIYVAGLNIGFSPHIIPHGFIVFMSFFRSGET